MTMEVKIIQHPFEVTFPVGSISEALGAIEAEATELTKLFGLTFAPQSAGIASENGAAPTTEKKKPGRPPKNIEAPAPINPPVNSADPLAIPQDLARTANPTTPIGPPLTVAPPALPVPPAPPPPPPAPPTGGVLAGKIIASLDARATDDAARQMLADWLATANVNVIKGATYAEACSVLRMQSDEKLSPLLAPLGLA
jgi:hypothetical protein